MNPIRVPSRFVLGVLAAAAIVTTGAPAALAATIGPALDQGPTLLALATPTVKLAVRNSAGTVVTSVTVGTTVHPWVQVSGSSGTPTGSVNILRWNNLNCFGTHVSGSGVSLTNGTVDATYLPFSSKDEMEISYRARYLGDATYAATDGPCVGITITKATPTISFALHDPAHTPVTSVPYGTPVHGLVSAYGSVDTATGTASISRYTTSDCTGAATTFGPTALNSSGTVHANGDFTFAAPGTYSFRAYYWGDSTYSARASTCRTFTVTKATPILATVLHDAAHAVRTSVLVGQQVHARATLSSPAGTPTGNMTIRRFADASCTVANWTQGFVAAATMDPAGSPFSAAAPQTAYFQIEYLGSAWFNAVVGPCMPMTWKATPTVSASVHDAAHHAITSIRVGRSVHVAAVVGGAFGVPTGAVTFRVSTAADCDGPQPFGARALSGGSADDTTVDYVPATPGTYAFEAVYDGNGTYAPRISGCMVLTVTPAPTPSPVPTPKATATPAPTAAPAATATPGAPSVPVATASDGPSASPSPAPSGGDAPSPPASGPAADPDGSSGAPSSAGSGSGAGVATPSPAVLGAGPGQPAATTEGSGSAIGIVAVGLVLVLIVGWLVARRLRHTPPA